VNFAPTITDENKPTDIQLASEKLATEGALITDADKVET
jgi:hypothetical protein